MIYLLYAIKRKEDKASVIKKGKNKK